MRKISWVLIFIFVLNTLSFAAVYAEDSSQDVQREAFVIDPISTDYGTEEIYFTNNLPKAPIDSLDNVHKYLRDNTLQLGLPSEGEFEYVGKTRDSLGIEHVRYQQSYMGIPVFGSDIIVDVKDRSISSILGSVDSNEKLLHAEYVDNLGETRAKEIAEDYLDSYEPENIKVELGNSLKQFTKVSQPELTWLEKDNELLLAYSVDVSCIEPQLVNEKIFIDADTGETLMKINNIRTDNFVGTGKGVLNDIKKINLDYYNSKYYMVDATLGDSTWDTKSILTYDYKTLNAYGYFYLMTDNNGKLCETSTELYRQRAGVDAHHYFGAVYKYYKDNFNRISYDNAGTNVLPVVHYTPNGAPWRNAAWTGNDIGLFIIGDGDSSPGAQKKSYELSGALDVIGHEFTHAVIENNGNGGLTYYGQSGAIDESISDLFGQIIERKYKGDINWTIGEDVSVPPSNSIIRSMANPEAFGQPSHYSQYVNTSEDDGGVHINSGIPNKAAYLIASQIGDAKTAEIYYYALMHKLYTSANFLMLRRALVDSAKILYPYNDYSVIISKAFDQVGVTESLQISSITTDKSSPQTLGNKIRWICNTVGGTEPMYYFRIYKGSSVAASSNGFSNNNFYEWTPSELGSDYRAYVSVKEKGSSTELNRYSDYYSISFLTITSITPDKPSPQKIGTKIRWTCDVSGAVNPVYNFKVYKGGAVVASSGAFSNINYFDWIPNDPGINYSVYVTVKENGFSHERSQYSLSYNINYIDITSITTDLPSPQAAGTKIRWICNTSGAVNPLYYFKIYKGSNVVASSDAFSSNNYIDWTPDSSGDNYKVNVTVKENGSNLEVNDDSGYYTITNYLQLPSGIFEWVTDEENGYIYAISQASGRLYFINYEDFRIVKDLYIGFIVGNHYDIDYENGKIYVSYGIGNNIMIINAATMEIETTFPTMRYPSRIAIDGDKLFYSEEDGTSYLWVHNLTNNTEDYIATLGGSKYRPELAVDKANHILYWGESGISRGNVYAIKTTDYSVVSQTNYEGGGFPYPSRNILYGDGKVFYSGYELDAGDLTSIEANLKNTIIYTKAGLAFTTNSVYDTDKYVKIRDLPRTASKVFLADNGYTYILGSQNRIYRERLDYELDTTMHHSGSQNDLVLDESLTEWVTDEAKGYIYAVSKNTNKLLFIRTSDLCVEREVFVGSDPQDIELCNGMLYIAMGGANKVVMVDPESGAVMDTLTTIVIPYRIAIDGDKLFYTENIISSGVYVYNLSDDTGNKIGTISSKQYPHLAVDNTRHILYLGETNTSGQTYAYAFNTTDYAQVGRTNTVGYTNGTITCEDTNLYYGYNRYDVSNINTAVGRYSYDVTYTNGVYIFTKNGIYNRDMINQIGQSFGNTADLACMADDNEYFIYNNQSKTIYRRFINLAISSIDSNLVSPQPLGKSVTFTANASGGMSPLYRYKVNDGIQEEYLSEYNANPTYTWTPTKTGTYLITVYVKDSSSSKEYDAFKTVRYVVTEQIQPVSISSITTSPEGSQMVGTAITLTTNATGGKELYYRYELNDGERSTFLNDYSLKNTYIFIPAKPGMYTIKAYVKDKDSTADYDATMEISHVVDGIAPIEISSLMASPASPEQANRPITFTATASGGTHLQYMYSLYDGTSWRNITEFTESSQYVWTPKTPGGYRIKVSVKDAVTGMTSEKVMDYIVTYAIQPVEISYFKAYPASPRYAGTDIELKATATDGTGLSYRFEVYDGTTCTEQSSYTTDNTYVWTPEEAGDYKLYVYIKELDSTEEYDAYEEMNYTVLEPAAPVEISSFKAYPGSPQPVNMDITLRARAEGGSSLKYRFGVDDGTGYIDLTDYSTDNTYVWTPEKPGDYTLYLYVKDKYSIDEYSAYDEIGYTVTEATDFPVINSLKADNEGPLTAGTEVTLTAKAAGGTGLKYMFRVHDGRKYTNLSSYSTDDKCIWIPTKPGTYRVYVYVKEEGSAADYDAVENIIIEVE